MFFGHNLTGCDLSFLCLLVHSLLRALPALRINQFPTSLHANLSQTCTGCPRNSYSTVFSFCTRTYAPILMGNGPNERETFAVYCVQFKRRPD